MGQMNHIETSKPAYEHPWQMTKAEWDAEREKVRPCYAQSNFTKSSASESTRNMRRLEWLLFDARHDEREKLDAATRGELQMSSEEAEELLEIIRTPIRYSDVIARAARLGLITAGCA